ncbi:alkaline phosphatase family protein [Robertkochia marina]|uniref:Alkaline phosphatase family protein n=1 Tax=Robertkochia marina TaxID=1227945 RepID=A0A4V3UY05_9FLAO|nr:nucleotide pyrophosphatase/phosphodiesterase family protein [Robertkochia marina]THD66674.1 alkaline phosphatase family protein [Robertkochia marina]TRZ45488.1 alkaline phosphatase family protein [Robertkochia marina]
MKKTVVINVVGLSETLIGDHTPFLRSYIEKGSMARVRPVFPAVTCTAQSTYLTGRIPAGHGIVGNGWYFKEEYEVKFWRQSNRLVQGEKIWDVLRKEEAGFSCANLFWWYNMYASADYSVTPRPNYLADGRKIPDVYSYPADLRDELQDSLGQFPLFKFWGPATDISSSEWIAEAAKMVDEKYDPTLTFIYLPHLDYNLQRYGPDLNKVRKDLEEIDLLVKDLVSWYEKKEASILVLSEYGITPVSQPVHINRTLREHGFLSVRTERGRELLDAGASEAFAVADHQAAHVYVKHPENLGKVAALLNKLPGVESVWTGEERAEIGLDHERAGDIVVSADANSWFTYYYWLDDKKAPDFARTVDIHRKPGYDPAEMFTDPEKPLMPMRIVWKLLKKKLGFRTLMDVIPLRADLIKGSHGRIPENAEDFPVVITNSNLFDNTNQINAHEVFTLIKDLVCKSRNYEKSLS